MELNLSNVEITLTFTAEDLAWLKSSGAAVPPFWSGHGIPPALGDVLRLADRQFAVVGRAWEHNGTRPVLRLYLTASQSRADTTLH